MTQNFNRYAYCLNNPLIYTDPDGEFVIAAALIGMAVAAAIDYGVQVGMNYAKGLRGNEAWFGQVDFVDVGISAAVGFLTAGSAASLKLADAGVKTASGFAQFLAKPGTKQFIKHGSKVLSASIDFKPSEGLQIIGGDDLSAGEVALRLGTSYAVDFAAKKVTDQFTDRIVRRKAIEYQWALREGGSRLELDQLRTDYEFSSALNRLNKTLYNLRPEVLQIPELNVSPLDDLILSPANDFPNAVMERFFDDVNGYYWEINWY
jgi:hypothetical protein